MVELFNTNSKGWAKSKAVIGAPTPANIDSARGILYDVVLCQAMQPRGEAGSIQIYDEQAEELKTVRVITGSDFIERLVVLGQRHGENGHQVRFGHPGMCDQVLGTYCGRVKNIRLRDNQAIGDIYLSAASENAPGKGNLKEYILNLAREDSQAIMMSIVFTPDEPYFINEDGVKEIYSGTPEQNFYLSSLPEPNRCIYETVRAWHYTDFVDAGANSTDLFRGMKGDKMLSAKLFEFLDENENVMEALAENPEIVREFIDKYETYRNRKNQKSIDMNKNSHSLLQKAKDALDRLFKNAEGEQLVKSIDAVTVDGVAISIESEGEYPAVGDVVTLTGTAEAPPAGEHLLSGEFEGWKITTDEAGVITAVTDPNAVPVETPVEPVMAEEVESETEKALAEALEISEKQSQIIAQLQKQIGSLSSDIETLKKTPLAERVFANANGQVSNLYNSDEVTPWEAERRRIMEGKNSK
jgi:hypothetical protein